jgi:drug/metabolite transporter (DMT)-like permease
MDRRGWTMLWALALLWGASYMFIEVALEDGLHPVFLVFVRLVLAGLILLPLASRTGRLRELPALWRPVLVLAVIQVVVPFLLISFGQEHVASGLTGVLIASAPIFTALLGMAGFGAERTSGWSLAGVLVGIVGVAILFGADLTGSSDLLLGGSMILLAALGYAVGAIYLRERLAGAEPVAVAGATMSAAALVLLPAALFLVPDAVPPVRALGAVAALGLLGTGVAFAIFYRLIAEYGAHKASVVAYLAPGFALMYGALLLDEPVTLGGLGGLALILAGSYTAAQGRPPWRLRTRPAAAPAPA